jgi:hypothetical protein
MAISTEPFTAQRTEVIGTTPERFGVLFHDYALRAAAFQAAQQANTSAGSLRPASGETEIPSDELRISVTTEVLPADPDAKGEIKVKAKKVRITNAVGGTFEVENGEATVTFETEPKK